MLAVNGLLRMNAEVLLKSPLVRCFDVGHLQPSMAVLYVLRHQHNAMTIPGDTQSSIFVSYGTVWVCVAAFR